MTQSTFTIHNITFKSTYNQNMPARQPKKVYRKYTPACAGESRFGSPIERYRVVSLPGIKGPAPSRNRNLIERYSDAAGGSRLLELGLSESICRLVQPPELGPARSHGHTVTVAAAACAVPGPAGITVEPEPARDSVTCARAAGGPGVAPSA